MTGFSGVLSSSFRVFSMDSSRLRAGFIIALSFLFTGCAISGGASPSPSPISTPTMSPPSTLTSRETDPNAPEGQCGDNILKVTVEASSGGASAGHINSNIVFTNTGSDVCELRGAPGVSVLGPNDTELGQPAKQQEAETPPTIKLASGGTVVAPLQSVNIVSGGGPLGSECQVVMGISYRIYPPHSFTAFIVPAEVPACNGNTVWMKVGAVAQNG
jgi:hypothetical protein